MDNHHKPVPFAVQITIILVVLGITLTFLHFAIGVVNDFLAETRAAGPGEKLQAVTGFLGSLIGALLAGVFAVLTGAWVYRRERDERVHREALEEDRRSHEIDATAQALFDWLNTHMSRVLTCLEVIENCAKKKIEKHDVAALMPTHARDLIATLPSAEFRERIRDHFPATLVALDLLAEHHRTMSHFVLAHIIDERHLDHRRKPYLEPTAGWAFSMAQTARTMIWPLQQIAVTCPIVDELVETIMRNLTDQARRIETWAFEQGVKPHDFSHLLPRLRDAPSFNHGG